MINKYELIILTAQKVKEVNGEYIYNIFNYKEGTIMLKKITKNITNSNKIKTSVKNY